MKKTLFILGTIFILLLFACDFTLPSRVEIRASPSLEFAVNMNFSDKFSGIMGDGFGDAPEVKILEVNFPPDTPDNIKTFLISIELYNREFDFSSLEHLVGVPLPYDIDLTSYIDPPEIELPLSEFNESSIDDFKFDENKIRTYLFVSGSDIVSISDITLEVENKEVKRSVEASVSSGVDSGTVDSMPEGGIDLELESMLNERIETTIRLSQIFLRTGATIDPSWVDGYQPIKLEIVIWLPLSFLVDEDLSPAEFTIDGMDNLGEVVDAIVDAVPIEHLSLRVKMNENPFRAGELLIISGEGESEREFNGTMTGNALVFTFNEEDVDYINNNDFFPNFKIVFEYPDGFHIPNVLIIRTIALDMRFNHVIEL